MEPNGKLFTDYAKITTAVVPGMSFRLQTTTGWDGGMGYYEQISEEYFHRPTR